MMPEVGRVPRSAGHTLQPSRLTVAVTILVLFNVVAIALVLAGGLPAEPWIFVAWFVGDIVVGLIALGLTDRV